MKNTKKIILVMSLIFLILFNGIVLSQSKSSNNKSSGTTVMTKGQLSVPLSTEQSGKEIYKKYCLTCHQSNGTGVPGMFPPLGPGSWTGKNPTDLIALILKGLNGEIEVDGERYKNNMPPQLNITDQELADVLTFVRTNFGNNFEPVTAEMVKKVRAGMDTSK